MSAIIDGTNGVTAATLVPSGSSAPTNGIYLPTTNAVAIATNSTNALYIDGSQNVGIGVVPSAWDASYKVLQLQSGSGGCVAAQNGGDVELSTNQYIASGGTRYYLQTGKYAGYYAISAYSGVHQWFTAPTGTAGNAISFNPAMTLDNSGNLLVGTTSQQSTAILSVVGGASKNGIGIPVANGQTGIIVSNTGAYNYSAQTFFYNSSQVGSISISSTSTAYNTSSDYRLKTNVTPLTTAQSGPIIDALKPSQFTWKEDNSSDVGFIAHEIQAVIPRAVTGEKDAVDAEGKPVYQQVVVSSPEIIAYLVAEIQSLRARLKAANIA